MGTPLLTRCDRNRETSCYTVTFITFAQTENIQITENIADYAQESAMEAHTEAGGWHKVYLVLLRLRSYH